MIYHAFDPVTGEHVGQRVAPVDPLETAAVGEVRYALPGQFETAQAPPDVAAGEAATWSGTGWTITQDHRGETWWTAEGAAVTVTELGDPSGAGLLSAPPPAALAAAKTQRIAEAYAESQARFAASTVEVVVGGQLRVYGCDPATRENITAINTAIGRAPELVPNPRPFTPRGEPPVLTTHAEFLAIYLAGISKGDAFYGVYYTHKIAIQALTTVEAVQAYDISTGWES